MGSVMSFRIRNTLSLCHVTPESFQMYDIKELNIRIKGGRFFPSVPKSATGEEGVPEKNKGAKEGYATFFALLEDQSHLQPVVDSRHQTTIAVADQGNDRVTLFGFRPKSSLFPPKLRGTGFIGQAPGFCKMKSPSTVSYTGFGDLAVCDLGNKRVLIFGPDQTLAHVVARSLNVGSRCK